MADIAASVLAKLKNKAKASGISYQQCLQLFFQEEFLRRLAGSKYAENFVLKGGLFIYTLTNFESRATVDVDFLMRGLNNDLARMDEIIAEILAVDTGNDFVTFKAGRTEPIAVQRKYHGVSTQITGYIKNVRVPFSEDVFNHDVIVNDSLSAMAKKLNEVYTAQYAGAEERNRPDFAQYIQKKAEKDWNALDYFTLYSNIYSAMNLRTKLNLLGLDFVKDGNGANTALIAERHGHKGEYAYNEYFVPSVRNALIAQEHARWNTYHLLSEYLPLDKNGITLKSNDGKKVRFNVKNTAAKKHACLTTYNGLNDLSSYLAENAGNGCTAADYDYYIYDEMLITSAEELLTSLGYSVIEK